jgi:hypothetical protein
MAAAEIKKPCCLLHNNTADEPKFLKKKKNTIHNATRSPDLVGLYKTMRGAELQDHILKKKKVVYCPDKTTNRQQRQTMGKKNTLANA